MTSSNDSNKTDGEKGLEPKRKVGRPPKYDPAFCERVEEMGSCGCSIAEIAYELEVVRNTLKDWARNHPAFSTAMDRARELSLGWWEIQGRRGIWAGKEFNAQAYRLQVMNRFPKDWRDTKQIELKGALANIDVTKLSDSQLARISAGEHPLQVLASEPDKDPPAEQKALPPAGDDGEVGEG